MARLAVPILKDIPIFYQSSDNPQNEHWWGFTGYKDGAHGGQPLSKVYFTESFLKFMVSVGDPVGLGFTVEGWEMVFSRKLDWVVKRKSDGMMWVLKRSDPDCTRGYIIAVWPD